MAENPQVALAHLARSCARLLARSATVNRNRLSGESIELLARCERSAAELLTVVATSLQSAIAGDAAGPGAAVAAVEAFEAAARTFGPDVEAAEDLGSLRDVLADVARDAARLTYAHGGVRAGAPASSRGATPAPRRSRSAAAAVPPTALAPSAGPSARRRPKWRPPSSDDQPVTVESSSV